MAEQRSEGAAAFHALARGRVQGVGFRYFTQRAAARLGVLDGYVRNTPDGAVEVVATGDKNKLTEFLSELRRGPSYSRVTTVDAEWLDKIPDIRGFDIRF